MKTEPSPSLRKVWAMKEAAEEETKDLASAEEYFRHIRKATPHLRLPDAATGAPSARRGNAASAGRRWRNTGKSKSTSKR